MLSSESSSVSGSALRSPCHFQKEPQTPAVPAEAEQILLLKLPSNSVSALGGNKANVFGFLAECLETGMMLCTKPHTLPEGTAGSRMFQANACASSCGSCGTSFFFAHLTKQNQIWGGIRVGRGLDGARQCDQLPSLLIELILIQNTHRRKVSQRLLWQRVAVTPCALGSP